MESQISRINPKDQTFGIEIKARPLTEKQLRDRDRISKINTENENYKQLTRIIERIQDPLEEDRRADKTQYMVKQLLAASQKILDPQFGGFSQTKSDTQFASTKLSTADVIAAMQKSKSLLNIKRSTKDTDEKRYGRIISDFPYLTTNLEGPLAFLEQFKHREGGTGKYETGRYLLDFYDRLNRIYQFAVDNMGFPANPMGKIERPIPIEKPLHTLSWEELAALVETPEDDTENACLDMALGCGWRPIEVRRITAGDVRKSRNNLIICHGKERTENAPFLN